MGNVEHAGTWVEAAPFRAHLQHLMAASRLPVEVVAQLVGISPLVAHSLLSGRAGRTVRKVSPEVARRLLRVTTEDARGVTSRLVPAAATRDRLAELAAAGVGIDTLAARHGVPLRALQAVADGADTCDQRVALVVKAVWAGLGCRDELRYRLPAERRAA